MFVRVVVVVGGRMMQKEADNKTRAIVHHHLGHRGTNTSHTHERENTRKIKETLSVISLLRV